MDVPEAHAEAIANFLIEQGAPGIESRESGHRTVVKGHFLDEPPIVAVQLYCQELGIDDALVRTLSVPEEDWAENWKMHFQPTSVGRHLMICPPWATSTPTDRITIVISPGMAFGTGQHPTTVGCLEVIEQLLARRTIRRAVDLGTGSGILAIALAKLGVQRVAAIDNDPIACAIARENVAANGVTEIVSVDDQWGESCLHADLLVANLFADLLIRERDRISTAIVPGGDLICSGFLEPDVSRVRIAFEQHGGRCTDLWTANQWVTLCFELGAQA